MNHKKPIVFTDQFNMLYHSINQNNKLPFVFIEAIDDINDSIDHGDVFALSSVIEDARKVGVSCDTIIVVKNIAPGEEIKKTLDFLSDAEFLDAKKSKSCDLNDVAMRFHKSKNGLCIRNFIYMANVPDMANILWETLIEVGPHEIFVQTGKNKAPENISGSGYYYHCVQINTNLTSAEIIKILANLSDKKYTIAFRTQEINLFRDDIVTRAQDRIDEIIGKQFQSYANTCVSNLLSHTETKSNTILLGTKYKLTSVKNKHINAIKNAFQEQLDGDHLEIVKTEDGCNVYYVY